MAQYTGVSNLPWAELTDTPNAQTATQNLANALDSITVPRFASFTARDAAITSPVAGQKCVITGFDTPQSYTYRGSLWRLDPLTRQLPATATVANSNAQQSMGGTAIYFQAGRTYGYTANYMANAGNSTGIVVGFVNAAGGAFTITSFGYRMRAATDQFLGSNLGYVSSADITTIDNGTSTCGAMSRGTIQVANAGLVSLGYRQASTFIQTSTMYGGGTWWEVFEL